MSEPRRVITIEEKLKVINYYKELKASKQNLRKAIQAPAETQIVPGDKVAKLVKKRKREDVEAKKLRRTNLEKACREKFPELVKHNCVLRWVRTCEKERWNDLPQVSKNTLTTTPNIWRQRVGAPKKGRAIGGQYPMALQEELDRLIMELTSGNSDISERKEVVTAEDVVSGLLMLQN